MLLAILLYLLAFIYPSVKGFGKNLVRRFSLPTVRVASFTCYLEYFSESGFGDDKFTKSARKDFNSSIETIYGELLPSSLTALLSEPIVMINDDDIIYDLGSGTGKIVAQFAYDTPCKRAIGIELGERRHSVASSALQQLTDHNDPNLRKGSEKIQLINADLLQVPWEKDATVLFINAFCFPPSLMVAIEARVKQSKILKYVFLCGQRFNPTMHCGTHYESYFEQSNAAAEGHNSATDDMSGEALWPFNLYPMPAPMTFSDQTEVQLYVSHDQVEKFLEKHRKRERERES